jgi:hypothetical protein
MTLENLEIDNNSKIEGIISCFSKLANEYNDPKAMVTLGAIYSDDPYNRHKRDFPPLASCYEPHKAFPLIEKGVEIAESMAENPLGYVQYDEISCAYHSETRKVRLGNDCYFKGSDFIIALAKKLKYSEKALTALKQGKGTSNIPKENIEKLIEAHKTKADSAEKELMYRMQAQVSAEEA